MISLVKNFLKTNKYFWKYRHVIDKNVWSDYYASYHSNRRNFYSEYVNKAKFNSVFEFGCASGPNLKNTQSFSNRKIFCFGYDINIEAIKFARKNFDNRISFFTHVLDKLLLERKLQEWGLESFDFAIYDRVLYLLTEASVLEHFEKYGSLFGTLVIDDFHNSDFMDSNDAYQSKNYEEILMRYGFELIDNTKSEHIASDGFFERSARRLVFQKRHNG